MFDIFTKFTTFPKSVKTGIILLVVSWCWFYYSMYYIFLGQDLSNKLLAVGPMICFAVFRIVNWARVLCLASNAMLIAYCLIFAYAFYSSNMTKFGAAVITVVLFGITSYYLAIKESSVFFKTYNKPPDDEEEDSR